MTDKYKQIEEIEYRYLSQIKWCLTNHIDNLLFLLNTKQDIRGDWINQFEDTPKNTKSSEMAKGAERVFATLFPSDWIPNSCPIGADFMFETHDAMVHIDIKTSGLKNHSDNKGKVAIGKNQTSYFRDGGNIAGNLPMQYTVNRLVNEQFTFMQFHRAAPEPQVTTKICTTYFILVVYEPDNQDIVLLLLICVPNGTLYGKYADEITQAGKNKGESFRFVFKKKSDTSQFKTLTDSPNRFEILFLNKKYLDDEVVKFICD